MEGREARLLRVGKGAGGRREFARPGGDVHAGNTSEVMGSGGLGQLHRTNEALQTLVNRDPPRTTPWPDRIPGGPVLAQGHALRILRLLEAGWSGRGRPCLVLRAFGLLLRQPFLVCGVASLDPEPGHGSKTEHKDSASAARSPATAGFRRAQSRMRSWVAVGRAFVGRLSR